VSNFEAVFDLIDRLVVEEMAASDTPGLSLAVTDRSGLLGLAAYGYADVDARSPVRPGHLFEFGSIGKSFTATLLLQLAEAGRLDLNAPLTEYLPWFEIQSEYEPITLHHLLTHTAGIIRGTDFPADPRFEVWALRDTSTSAPPGELFHYSNVGYKALGLVLERLTGQSYAALLRERIFAPLGMRNSEPVVTHAMRHRLARGYVRRYDDRPWRLEHGNVPATWLETNTADGCISATPADLAAYLRMLMNGGEGPSGPIIAGESFKLMTSPFARHAEIDPSEGRSYGYGLDVRYEGDRLVRLRHTGGMVGYESLVDADLAHGYGVVTMVNGACNQQGIVDFALEALAAADAERELPDVPSPSDRFEVANAAALAGVFTSPEGDLTVEEDGNGLKMRLNGHQARLEMRGESAFIVHDEQFERFALRPVRDDDERLVGWTYGPRVWRAPGEAGETPRPPAHWSVFTGHYRSHNPWHSNFRVILREDQLLLVFGGGHELRLFPRDDGSFRVGRENLPETIRFDSIVDGEAWRATFSGADYYRFFTP
jgi:CubicO group peptidase (beta-lactamase class C family)